ncbi:hypothetical protein GOODEAATRI_019621, partial [Goodea atripinnis]
GSIMTGDAVVLRGLGWIKQAASRAPTGSLTSSNNHRLVSIHPTIRSPGVGYEQ